MALVATLTQRFQAIQDSMQPESRQPGMVPFGEYLPDQADFNNPGCTDALGVLPDINGFRPFKDLTVTSDALSARARGLGAASDTGGAVSIYAGDQDKLYHLIRNGWVDISKSGGYSGTSTSDSEWQMEAFGQTFIATNFDDPVQSIAIGGTVFADLIDSADTPKARHLGVVREFVVLGNTSDGTDGIKPERVWWSGINDATDFTPAASTQCDFQDIPEGGWVMRIVGGVEYGLIFQERRISRMTYVGSPLVFRIDAIDRKRGTPISGSVIGHGRNVFFISEEGFMVTNGQNTTPIGDNRVDRFFWDQFDTQYISRVSAAIDPLNKLVMWAFPGTGNSAGTPNKILIYSWGTNRWSRVDKDLEILGRSVDPGYTLDGLDDVSTDLDALAFSLDSRAWTGGDFQLAAFDTSHKYGTFVGSNLAAVIETSEFEQEGQNSQIDRVRPLVDGTSATITAALATRDTQNEQSSFGTAIDDEANGDVSVSSEGRYHKVQVNIAAGGTWTRAQGVQVFSTVTGFV